MKSGVRSFIYFCAAVWETANQNASQGSIIDLFFVYTYEVITWADFYCDFFSVAGNFASFSAISSLLTPGLVGHLQFNAIWEPDYSQLEYNASRLFDQAILAVAEIALNTNLD